MHNSIDNIKTTFKLLDTLLFLGVINMDLHVEACGGYGRWVHV